MSLLFFALVSSFIDLPGSRLGIVIWYSSTGDIIYSTPWVRLSSPFMRFLHAFSTTHPLHGFGHLKFKYQGGYAQFWFRHNSIGWRNQYLVRTKKSNIQPQHASPECNAGIPSKLGTAILRLAGTGMSKSESETQKEVLCFAFSHFSAYHCLASFLIPLSTTITVRRPWNLIILLRKNRNRRLLLG